ncbi:MAG: delta-aminolevulinic acid dehydratase [candidate division Zixibacteria bacterium]|nr:delta-aminolevulinic acid dehydratase [candidate division Zixibacteria bacterium]
MQKLLNYCEEKDWKGYDPYDGLNTPWRKVLPLKGKILRILLIQFLKRCPLNLRKLFLIKEDYNPKGLGLCVSTLARLYEHSREERYKKLAYRFIDLLFKTQSKGYSGMCWGYNFDWQSKAFFLPRYTPTVVATSFIANAFLDAYQAFKEQQFLKIARTSCDFICHDLNRTHVGKNFCFSYSPLDKTTIHNANILGAHLLARTASFTGEDELKKTAHNSIKFVIDHQNPDGSWYYGTKPNHRWIDNFHTGFVLECLFEYINLTSEFELKPNLERGLKFYQDNFFLADGTPKYYHDRIYPIDIHSCAQSIITLVKLGSVSKQNQELAEKVALWTLENMQDLQGYFYFQKKRFFTNRIAYMRWSQAWMIKALVTLLTGQEEFSQKILVDQVVV